jgi:hypothetical protein
MSSGRIGIDYRSYQHPAGEMASALSCGMKRCELRCKYRHVQRGLSQKAALGMRHMAASNILHPEVQVVGQKLKAPTMKP